MGQAHVLLLLAVLAGQTAAYPPPFPRPGTTKILENEAVAVWNVSWLKQQYPLHTHLYDLVGISYAEGDRIITQGTAPGRLVNTKAWVFQTNRAGVTHVEEGASDPPMRAVLIEVKAAAPRPAAARNHRWPAPSRRAACVGEQSRRRLARHGRHIGAKHRHVGDAVELTFDGTNSPKAEFVSAGTVHAGLPPEPAGERTSSRSSRGRVMKTSGWSTYFLASCALVGAAAARPLAAFGQAVDNAKQASSPSALRITD